MSLVENLARRQPSSLELMREIGALRERGYSVADISKKTDLSTDYIGAICYLLEHGENRLLVAVERGVMPPNIAIEIARASEAEVQQALADAYENKVIPGNQVLAIRRIIQARQRLGKGTEGSAVRSAGPGKVTAQSLIQSYQKEVKRQKLMTKKSELAESRLAFVINAVSRLLADDAFLGLLRQEDMESLPRPLAQRLGLEEA
jgi:ParB family chromosome partitioning protein